MNIEQLYQLYKQSYKVSTDTRKITKGCIFFALKGENFNGNEFADEALKKGASYAVIDEEEFKTSDATVLFDDVLTTLQLLATYHRKQLGMSVIALTGSNGKTTTKELINAVLSTSFKTTATQGNLNNHIGVPLTLLSMTTDTEIGIVEMGANHLREIEFLCNIALPDFGYITNFGKAHLEGFGSIEGVIKGKTELYRHLEKRNKKVFVNANDQIQMDKTKDIQRFTFGHKSSNLNIELIDANPFVLVKYDDIIIKSNLIGSYNFNNIAAAIAIGHYFKVDKGNIKTGIENYFPENNRSQILNKNSNKIILDAYNANPTSMQAALDNFSGLKEDKKIVVLGDMFELGKDAAVEHQIIRDVVAKMKVHNAYLIGENFYKTKVKNEGVLTFKSFDDFKQYYIKNKVKDALFLIKASRGMALERVVELI
ncbi:MAG: UDP-N-acetylmuramoyl-tripeptide--D-alanyl-D-alanine ligase [Flavobacteriaceae bacterium]|nr:UDP-N-acetylmuramoyl-tripeptide--D-alanyl-D-alanine ligase [Flavobacteriaceae bacterium]